MQKNIAIKVENLSKLYRLGEVGSKTLGEDLNRFYAKLRGKEDPYSLIGQANDRTSEAKGDFVWALKDINFEVKQGEVLGIIGKNGSGKSTLLKLISQITSPTTGMIKAKGRVASLLEVGTGMHPEMTARENIFLNGAILGMTKKEINTKFDEIIDFAGCQLYVDTPIKRFSSGMRVRLGFAVAAFLEPEILIVDEVLAVGDAEFQKKAIGKMKDISAGGGRTVLFVSHNMASVKSLCDKGLLLEEGRITAYGEIDDVLDKYLLTTVFDEQIKIAERTDREGSGKLKVNDITFFNKNKEQIDKLFIGDTLYICFEFDRKIKEDEKIVLAFSIVDKYNKQLVLWVTDELCQHISNCTSKLYFKIDSFNLRASTYYISYQLAFDKISKDTESDKLQKAKQIQVINKKNNDNGIIPRELSLSYMPIEIIEKFE
jgi:lipopolysaccharide transport system ATP-binding protein